MDCPLCGSLLKNRIDPIYYRCLLCDGLVMDSAAYPEPTAELAHYLTHNNDVNDPRYQAFVSPIVNFVLNNRLPREQGLDFGSGSGPVISKMLQDSGYQIAQYDPYFANEPARLEQPYHYIVSCEVIEHFFQPAKEFRRLRQLLLAGGQLICMTHLYDDRIPFANWYYRKDPTHAFIYTAATIRYIAAHFGFDTCQIDGRLLVLGAAS